MELPKGVRLFEWTPGNTVAPLTRPKPGQRYATEPQDVYGYLVAFRFDNEKDAGEFVRPFEEETANG